MLSDDSILANLLLFGYVPLIATIKDYSQLRKWQSDLPQFNLIVLSSFNSQAISNFHLSF